MGNPDSRSNTFAVKKKAAPCLIAGQPMLGLKLESSRRFKARANVVSQIKLQKFITQNVLHESCSYWSIKCQEIVKMAITIVLVRQTNSPVYYHRTKKTPKSSHLKS